MKKLPSILTISIFLIIISSPATAEIYKCIDADGQVTFNTKPGPGCTLLPGSVEKKQENPRRSGNHSRYDFTCRKSVNQYGVRFYNFKRLKGPPITLLPDRAGIADISQLNEILDSVGEPRIEPGTSCSSAGRRDSPFVWENYLNGKLVLDTAECKYASHDKKTYPCIKRLYITPSKKEMMRNQARNSSSRVFVSREEYGDQWPFTVDFGIIACRRGNAVVFRTVGNKVYALNGIAIADKRYGDVREIWGVNEKMKELLGGKARYTPRIDLSPMIRLGLSLCE